MPPVLCKEEEACDRRKSLWGLVRLKSTLNCVSLCCQTTLSLSSRTSDINDDKLVASEGVCHCRH